MAKQHITKKQLEKLHEEVGGTDNGACLTGHEGRYKKDKSCSYRWQAHRISIDERTKVYNGIVMAKDDKTYKRATIRNIANKGIQTSAYKTKKGKLHPAAYVSHLAPPGPGDWDLEGPTKTLKRKTISKRSESIPKKANFTKDRWPYWHNAHHLIPKSLLNDTIDEVGKNADHNPEASSIIRKCLLEAKYNVNFKINMIILPQDREVGRILRLPRHLILVQLSGDEKQIERVETACHEAYDRYVLVRLKRIINGFAGRIHKKKCEDPKNPGLAKDQLERLSTKLYDEIIKFGKVRFGDPIADMEKDTGKPAAKPAKKKKSY